jgi:hypothetical protein
LPIICIFGTEENMSLKSSLGKKKNLTVSEIPGDHRYNYNFGLLLKMIGI